MSLAVLLLTAVCFASYGDAYDWDEPTALDDYVHLDDGMFQWKELGQYRFEEEGVTVYLLNMTSQKWMDESFSSQSIWWHMMGVGVPDVVRKNVSYLYIDGGSNDPWTTPPANDSGNDPTGASKTEDAIIAWTWHSYLTDYKDTPEVILRMPMTKSAVRAMDAITEFLAQKFPGTEVNEFIVGGGSKRGWTAWSAAATDRRVIAVTPMVMSLMNFNDTLQAHYRNLGGAWSFTFSDYYEVNLTRKMHDDQVTNWDYGLWTYEDMFRYKERLAGIPKLLISATGDEFFLLTDSHTWWNEMQGDKWIMMVPNAEHSLVPWYLKIGQTIASWCKLILEGPAVPKVEWLRGDTGVGARVSLFVDPPPDNITAWYAHTWKNDTRKDFRLAVYYPPFIHPVIWYRTPVNEYGNGQYDVELPTPDVGFGGIFIECLWTSLTSLPMYLTTEVQVTPDVYPAPPCYGEECYAYLI